MMALNLSQPGNVNVLIGDPNWAWPQAVTQIFKPRGINAMVAETPNDMVRIIDNSKIHLAILGENNGIQTLKMIRQHDKLLPCMVLADQINHQLLSEALNLNVFSVLTKPVDMAQLINQLNRLFIKYYASNVFAQSTEQTEDSTKTVTIKKTKSIFVRWQNRDNK
ncbi:MAG: response regulator [Phycisphaerae bacterium]|nr:response regulator [Phycisphaerae bacterium]